jgi:hypothetical protein
MRRSTLCKFDVIFQPLFESCSELNIRELKVFDAGGFNGGIDASWFISFAVST